MLDLLGNSLLAPPGFLGDAGGPAPQVDSSTQLGFVGSSFHGCARDRAGAEERRFQGSGREIGGEDERRVMPARAGRGDLVVVLFAHRRVNSMSLPPDPGFASTP